MHIELTDHLRCPRDHPEAYLVLLPDQMDRRRVIAGHLGCPVCGWSTSWTDAVPDFGDRWESDGTPPLDASAAHALLGIDGPGGWIALAGDAGALAADLAALLPGVALVAVNPPDVIVPTESTSVIAGGAWPLKTHSMRAVVIGGDAARWRDAAMRSTLPGLRAIGAGEPPASDIANLLASADGIWVATRR